MKDNLGNASSRLPLEMIPKNLNYDIHLYYTENEDDYFYMLIFNLCKGDSILDDKNSIAENRVLSRFTIFQICNKSAISPAIGICNLLGQVVNSKYDITHSTKNIEVSFYQSDIGKVLEQRTKNTCMDKETFDKKLNRLNISLRNYSNEVKRAQFLNDNEHLVKRHFQNNKLPQPLWIKKLTDDLYHSSFIVPVKIIDCTNTERLPKFLYHFVKEKIPVLLNAPVEDINREEITIYSDASFNSNTGNYTATCAIFIKGLQGIFCSVNDNIKAKDSTFYKNKTPHHCYAVVKNSKEDKKKRDSMLPELVALNNASTIVNEIFNIEKGFKLTFLSDNQNLLNEIKKFQDGKPVQYSEICRILDKAKNCNFKKVNERNKVFRLVDRESKISL